MYIARRLTSTLILVGFLIVATRSSPYPAQIVTVVTKSSPYPDQIVDQHQEMISTALNVSRGQDT